MTEHQIGQILVGTGIALLACTVLGAISYYAYLKWANRRQIRVWSSDTTMEKEKAEQRSTYPQGTDMRKLWNKIKLRWQKFIKDTTPRDPDVYFRDR